MKLLIVAAAILLAQGAQASFIQNCNLDMVVKEINGPISQPELGLKPHHQQEVVAEVKGSETLSGSYAGCEHLIDQEITMNLEAVSLSQLVSLVPGQNISVKYNYSNFNSFTGISESTNYQLNGLALKAYETLLDDTKAQITISNIYGILAIGSAQPFTLKPVQLLSGIAQPLPGGFCGFVGCGKTFIVSLTYGEASRNAPTMTLVAKVFVDPVNSSVTILDDPTLALDKGL